MNYSIVFFSLYEVIHLYRYQSRTVNPTVERSNYQLIFVGNMKEIHFLESKPEYCIKKVALESGSSQSTFFFIKTKYITFRGLLVLKISKGLSD